jgi:hypothetical protein
MGEGRAGIAKDLASWGAEDLGDGWSDIAIDTPKTQRLSGYKQAKIAHTQKEASGRERMPTGLV